MAFIALLSARERVREGTGAAADGALIEFGGQPLVEFQARLAIAAGVDHILIQADGVTADLSRLIDRLTAERQASVALVRDMPTLSRSLAPADRILLIAENMLIPAEAVAALAGQAPPALLALPSVPATGGFERIDAEAMWAGALLLPGEAVLATLDMLGEWDLGLTVLRRAVQMDAHRVMLPSELVMDGRLASLHSQQNADAALQVLADQESGTGGDGDGLQRLLALFSRPLVRELVRRQIEPARLTAVALLLGVLGLALGIVGWAAPGVVLALLSFGLRDVAAQCAEITLRPKVSPYGHYATDAMAVALLALIGWRLSEGHLLALSGAWFPIFIAVLIPATRAQADIVTGLWAPWVRINIPIALLVALVGLLIGQGVAAFTLLGLLALAAVTLRLIPKRPKV
ncbi:MAG: hypothetical protein BGP16_18045 [Sphingobium sp. 66-54]|nr:MAG: hypothetical protein BGP16_18045 [Sphingobium sp. 66-54]